MMTNMQKHKIGWMCCFGLILCVLYLYRDLPGMTYLLWDDDLLVTENAILSLPFTAATRAAFGGYYNGDYIPISLMSYWCEVRVAGFLPVVQHVNNLLLHIFNIFLVWVWLRRFSSLSPFLFLIVAVFAIHPLQVESVAWVSERKGLLATTFYLLALICASKVEVNRRAQLRWDIAYIVFFILGALSKANGIFIPIWIALSTALSQRRWIPLGWPKHISALAVAFGFSVVRVLAYASAIPQFGSLALSPDRLLAWPLMTLAALGFYVKMIIAPLDLSIIYPSFTSASDWASQILWGTCACLFWVGGVVWLRLREALNWLLFGLLTLAPVLNLVPRINFVNDRYIYLPLIGFVSCTLLILQALWLRWQDRANRAGYQNRLKPIFVGICVVFIAFCAWLSKHRVAVWSSNITLWSDTVNKVPLSSLAQNNLGQAFQNQGSISDAIVHYQKSLDIAVDSGSTNLAYNNLATIYSSRQYPQYFNLPLARSLLESGIARVSRPDDSLVLRFNLALVHLQAGDLLAGKQALADLLARLELSPNQRYLFLVERVAQLQKTLEAAQ
jgi:hypothetical protein